VTTSASLGDGSVTLTWETTGGCPAGPDPVTPLPTAPPAPAAAVATVAGPRFTG